MASFNGIIPIRTAFNPTIITTIDVAKRPTYIVTIRTAFIITYIVTIWTAFIATIRYLFSLNSFFSYLIISKLIVMISK
jgi:hypothetical protein